MQKIKVEARVPVTLYHHSQSLSRYQTSAICRLKNLT
jgi:hypothetical protein